jgi:transketolase
MRNTFANLLLKKIEQAQSSGRAEEPVLITGDLGFSVLEPLKEKLGPAFINAGVAESLMTSIAAGIASEGRRVFTYSIVPFATFRCLEQIRNDICYHKLDVTIVGVGAGFGYGALGATHHATDDVAAMWALPNIRVYSPACTWQTEQAFEDAWLHSGPKYLRLGKGGEGEIASSIRETIEPGVYRYQSGRRVMVVCTGHVLSEVLKATAGLDVEVVSVCRLKPFPTKLQVQLDCKAVLVVEELNQYGGFGGMLATYLYQNGYSGRVSFLNAGDAFADSVGDPQWQRERKGLNSSSIARALHRLLGDGDLNL